MAVVHFTEIICCNTEITFVISMFDLIYVSFKKGITACYYLSLLRYIPIFKHNQDVHNFCITANDVGEVHDRNARWLKVPL